MHGLRSPTVATLVVVLPIAAVLSASHWSDVPRATSANPALAVGEVAAPSARAPLREGAAPAGESACTGTITSGLSALTARVCDPVTVTVRAATSCPVRPIHFVIIAPNGIAFLPNWLEATVRAVVDELELAQAGGLDVMAAMVGFNGVVQEWCPTMPGPYRSGARTLVDFTRDLGALRGIRFKPGQENCGDYLAAQREALRVLDRARAARGAQPTEIVMFFANTTYCVSAPPDCADSCRAREMLVQAGHGLRREVSSLLSVCTFDLPPEPLCRMDLCEAARKITSRDRYSEQDTVQAVKMVRAELSAAPQGGVGLDEQRIVQVLPPGLAYVTDSASARPQSIEAYGGGTRLVWARTAPTATLPLTITYAVGPRTEGRHMIGGTMAMTDTDGLYRVVAMDPVTLTVSGLCETATPEPGPTATITPSPTETGAPTATTTNPPTATATATPGRGAIFLPLVLAEHCEPLHRRADVALVIDTSSSMAGQKLEDAKAAAVAFVGQMDLAPGRDQATLVRYDAQAEVACRLASGRAVIEAAIRNLTSRSGTHIDKGLRLALAELQSPRHLERNMSVVILLTDGVQTGTPGEELRAAAEVRNAGVRLYTIGLGGDVDGGTLREMAGDDARYRFAPDSADLARIYAELASDILCQAPAGGFWPRP